MMTEVAKNQGMGINLSPKEQIASGTEVTAQVKPKVEVASMSQVPLVEAVAKIQISESTTKEDAIKEIDKILKNRKPEEVVGLLKHEIEGGEEGNSGFSCARNLANQAG